MSDMIIPAPTNRVHVQNPREWTHAIGTDYWANWGAGSLVGGATGDELSAWGWTVTSVVRADGGGADFLSAADPAAPTRIALDGGGDLLQSEYLFGDYYHGHAAAASLGYEPTQMTLEVPGQFAVSANNETATGFGLVEAGGTATTADDALAMFTSNGTNFVMRSGADSDTGAAVDGSWHLWTVVLSQGTTDAIEWFIDGVSQGTIDLQEDVFPAAFAVCVQAAGANRPRIGTVHISYS